jgi:hypothetical protein
MSEGAPTVKKINQEDREKEIGLLLQDINNGLMSSGKITRPITIDFLNKIMTEYRENRDSYIIIKSVSPNEVDFFDETRPAHNKVNFIIMYMSHYFQNNMEKFSEYRDYGKEIKNLFGI